MIFEVDNFLEKIGFGFQKRAIHAQFSSPILNPQLFIQRIDGHHEINKGLSCELICLSINPAIALKDFIGCRVAVDQITDLGQLFRTTGIVVEASQGQHDGSLSVYKLKLQDATSLWHKRRNSRVFMNKSVLDITQILFKEWQDKSPLFASSLMLDLSVLRKTYDVRPFTMQTSVETEYEFLTRLWRSEAINWLIDESQTFVLHNKDPIQAQVLRLIDANPRFKSLDRKIIRFHRSDATETLDTITSFTACRQLQPSSVHVQRWQPQHLEQEDGAGSVLSLDEQSGQYDNATLSLEDAWQISPAWVGDLKQEDGVTPASHQQVDTLNSHLSDQNRLKSKYFTAHSTVRDAQVGYWFKLNNHTEIDLHRDSAQEFLILSKHFYNQNNLPKDIQNQAKELLTSSRWHNKNIKEDEQRQGNTLTLIRREITVVPEYHPEQHKPTVHVQRAQVVGIEGEEIHVDEWGRIKVRFLFSRAEDNGHDSGAGSNQNDTDSAWVDVLTPWAGEGYGARFLPRVGEMVVIDFFDGNIDRPFVTGRLHEAHRTPTQFDQTGQLPDTKSLSGIRSQEINGSGYNQLRFDDTHGQVSAQLQSSHGVSQLNLGKLSDPKQKAKSKDRGEGFELRTDHWGAVRAGEGLLISTYKQPQAMGDHLDAQVVKHQIHQSKERSQELSSTAKKQETDEIETIDQLKAFADQLEKDVAKFNKALLVLSSPDGIRLSTAQDIHLCADTQISQTAGDSINMSTQNNLIAQAQNKISMFACAQGISAKAAKGNIDIHAQDGMLELIARKMIKMISTEDILELISPKGISLKSGGSEVSISPNGITLKSAQVMRYHAIQHDFKPSEKVDTQIPELPKQGPHAINFLFSDLMGRAQPNAKVEIVSTKTKEPMWKGKTDASGTTPLSVLDEKQTYKALVGFDYWASEFESEEQYVEDIKEDNIELGEHEAPQIEEKNDEMIANKGHKND
ncbi:type VI secretion system Vgr family protein [Acinetobacter boissieri]|uniref:Type VI secretion system secreted protein VgrG n=1 Tax=Acinetobacter boissieri TaxID=1219383 RepID=A0A1G6GLU4_9GAMM|nr:type VI secretion system Vgr family protein [Acinetobacter boissieri]SDB82937.1 type VI secretion system secreted protein VgrG [Acinetobacter boissieri]